MRRAGQPPLLALLLAACLLGGCLLVEPIPTDTPSPTATPDAGDSPSPLPASVAPSPSPAQSPGADDVPILVAGSIATTNAGGLRIRSRPGLEQRTITQVGLDVDLLIGLGPVMIDGFGWYLVRDADPAEPEFGEGWVAAGFDPDPFLVPAFGEVDDNPYLAGFAHDAPGEFGPVLLPRSGDVAIRWIAANTGDGCSFAVDLRPGDGEPVAAIRTPVGGFPALGELPRQYFASHGELRGDVFVTVTSDCSWALTFVRSEAPADDE